jgi:hypothetical protein
MHTRGQMEVSGAERGGDLRRTAKNPGMTG